MSPLNDKDLDRLSREAAEQFDVDQRTSGWEALESRLNTELPQKEEKDRKRFLFWLLFIVLLTGSSLYWLLGSDAVQSTPSPVAGATPATSNKTSTPGEASAASNKTGKAQATVPAENAAPAPGTATRENDKIDKTTTNTTRSVPGNTLQQSPADGNQIPSSKTTRQRKNTTTSHSLPVSNKRTKKQPVSVPGPFVPAITDPSVTASSREKNVTDPLTNVDKNPITPNPIPLPPATPAMDTAGSVPKTVPAASISDSNQAAAKKPAATPKKSRTIPLEIGVLAGADLSNVKFSSAGQGGYNLGLQAGYRFSNRWSVNTGIIYNKKNYKSRDKDFTKRGWLQNVDMENLKGNCSMLDLPLNVRYDFSINKQRRYFVSTGLSTYLMDREYYEADIFYNGMSRKWDRNTDSNSSYIFSIINFSLGFERSISKHFSVQAEPYLKIPLKGVGYGNLQLNSYGINFSLKYKLAGNAVPGKKP